jgi:hypothetical protein
MYENIWFYVFLLVFGMDHGVAKIRQNCLRLISLSNFVNVLGEIHKMFLYIKKLGEKYHQIIIFK